jgi:hypothetical protein
VTEAFDITDPEPFGCSLLSLQAFCIQAFILPIVRTDPFSTKAPSLDGRDTLEKRSPAQSVPTIRQKVIAGGEMRNKISIFWSSFDNSQSGFAVARQYSRDFQCDVARLYYECLPYAEWRSLKTVNLRDPDTHLQDLQKLQVLSAVFAQTSSGYVYVLLPDGREFRPGSVWINYEFPNLTAPGSAVDGVFIVGWPSKAPRSIWKKGDPQQRVWPPADADQSIFAG